MEKTTDKGEQMTLKGYKHTELGVLPEDWEVVRLGDVCDFLKTYSKSRSDLSEPQECINGIAYIHYGDIHTKFQHFLDMDKDTLPSIDSKKLAQDLEDIVFVKNGDLVIADASEDYDDIGKSIEIKNLSNPTVSGLHTILCRDKNNYFANGYKGYMFYLYEVHKQIKRLACGISVLGISKSNLSKILIPLPPLAEQEKIAEILSAWDTQIQNFETLIAEKQALKKGLCQTLLTAKTRLKGFSEDWEVVRLGEVGKCYGGLSGKSSKDFGDFGNCWYIPYVNIFSNQIIDENKLEKVWIDTEEEKQNQVVKGDILLTLSSETAKEVGICSLYSGDLKLYLNSFCFGFRIKNHEILSPLFASWLLTSQNTRKQIFRLAQGSTRYNLSKNGFLNVQIPLPPLAEQEKIAEILSEADNEITLLEQKLESLKSQKKGLMQNLLNGKVRVK